MNQKNLNYEIETNILCLLCNQSIGSMNQKNLNYEIETILSIVTQASSIRL